MRIERTFDIAKVDEVLDGKIPFCILPEAMHFVLVYSDSEELVGCFTLVPHSDICVYIHTNFISTGFRYSVLDSLSLIRKYIFVDVGWEKLLTEVPLFNVLAKRLALKGGMEYEGRISNSFRDKTGLHDMEIFGMTKGEYLCL